MTNDELQDKLFTDRALRTKITSESHAWFFSTYFANYLTHETADLHRELFAITEDEQNPLAVVVAFRGSGKSTIMTMSYPIWAVLGKQQKKFVLIASQTQYQARVHLTNIKRELESNELLKNDMGPFVEQREEWGSTSLYIPKYNARITAISTEQSVRGIRHGAYRPDLIIADDVEDMSSVKTREGRNKTFDWYTSEIVPAGDTNTKRIAVGNLLHEDSLLMRLKDRIDESSIDGTYHQWPIVEDAISTWPGKYPDQAAIETLQRSTANDIAWQREYMLRIVPDEDQVIDGEWIQYYDELPARTKENEYIGSFVSVDLAISQAQTADKTAIVTIHLYGHKPENRRYYVDPQVVNERMTHMETLEHVELMYHTLDADNDRTPVVLVESVQYQAAVTEQLHDRGIKAKGVKVYTDKRSRLQLAGAQIQMGRVYFPKDKRIDELVQQLVGFGVEKFDDLADAFSMGINYLQANVRWQSVGGWGQLVNGKMEWHSNYKIVYRDEQTKRK